MPQVNRWIWVVAVWIGVIFFSSTSLASKWAEGTFHFVSAQLFSNLEQRPSFDLIHLLVDKGFHVSLFCILAILLWQAIDSGARKPWFILGCGAVVGSCSEFLQRFFPDRDPALRDVLINIGGTTLGVLLCLALGKLKPRMGARDRREASAFVK
jgi:VanZ family protein